MVSHKVKKPAAPALLNRAAGFALRVAMSRLNFSLLYFFAGSDLAMVPPTFN
jgi:hypothetical protein